LGCFRAVFRLLFANYAAVNCLKSVVCNFYTLFSTGGGGARGYVSTRLKTVELEADSLVALAFGFSAVRAGFGRSGERGTEGPGDQGTRGPRDQGTKGPREPRDQGTRGPRGPRDQGTRGPRATVVRAVWRSCVDCAPGERNYAQKGGKIFGTRCGLEIRGQLSVAHI